MKKILGVIVAIIIFWIAGIISSILKIMAEQSRADMIDISEFQFVAMGLIPFIPFLIAIWLIKLSWRKITYEEPKEINTSSKKVDTSLPKAVYNHSKDIASDIKPTINKYKEKHQTSKNDTPNISSINKDIASDIKPTINKYKEKHQTSKNDTTNISSIDNDEAYDQTWEEYINSKQQQYKDDLYEKAKDIIKMENNNSVLFLQRKLKIGYNRAESILQQLESDGQLSETITPKNNISYNDSQSISQFSEDEIYEKVMLEIEEDNKVKSTWAKALAQSDGDIDKATSLYIKLRVDKFKIEYINKIEVEKTLNLLKINKEKIDNELISEVKTDKLNKYLFDRGMRLVERTSDNEAIACFSNSPIDCNLEFINSKWIIPSEREYKNNLNEVNDLINKLSKNEKDFVMRYTQNVETPFIEINEYEIIIDSSKYGIKKYIRK